MIVRMHKGTLRGRSLALFVLGTLFLIGAVMISDARAGDVVLMEDSPLPEGIEQKEPPTCPSGPKPRLYTTRAVTFIVDLRDGCRNEEVKYDITIEREAEVGVMDRLLGPGEPNWSKKHFSGICYGPCLEITMYAEHPWHESAVYWFDFAIWGRGPEAPQGKYTWGAFGIAGIPCGSNGVTAGCGQWHKTMHIPDSPDDIPQP